MWSEQWRRVLRWYATFERTEYGRQHDRESDTYLDEVLAFFQACYHLKDWLKHDSASGISSADVEAFISASPSLRLCGDLANGSKHLVLTTSKTGDRGTRVGPKHVTLELSDSMTGESAPPRISASYEVHSGGSVYDAFSIATTCIDDWKTFLKDHGFLP